MMFPFTTSTAFALAGTALFAVVIFVPRPRRETSPSAVTYAPPAPPPIERWMPTVYAAPDAADSYEDVVASAFPATAFADVVDAPKAEAAEPSWPQLIDARAFAADAAARRELARALCAVDTPWSRTIVARALADEHDETVRAELTSGRTARRSHPTPAYADES